MFAIAQTRRWLLTACVLLASCARPTGSEPVEPADDELANGASRPALPPLTIAHSPPPCADRDWKPWVETIVTLGDGASHLRFDADEERAVFLYNRRIASMTMADLGEQVLFRDFAGIPGVARLYRGTAYWTERGRFQKPVGAVRARYPGSDKATTLAFGLESPESLVVRRDQVRWLDWKTGGVYRPDGKAGKGIRIADAGDGLGHMATGFPRLVADRHHLYFSRVRKGRSHEDNGIVRTDWDGRDPLVIASDQHHVEILGVGDDYVFWATNKHIRRVAKTGGEITDLAPASFPTAMYVHQGYLYYIDNHIFDKQRGYGVVRIPTIGGELQTLHESPRSTYVVQKSGEWLFWIEHGHLASECREVEHHWESRGEDPPRRYSSTSKVCQGPAGRLLRMRLPTC